MYLSSGYDKPNDVAKKEVDRTNEKARHRYQKEMNELHARQCQKKEDFGKTKKTYFL